MLLAVLLQIVAMVVAVLAVGLLCDGRWALLLAAVEMFAAGLTLEYGRHGGG